MGNEHPECYGTLFPSVLQLPEDRPASGTVFTIVLLTRAGCGASGGRGCVEGWRPQVASLQVDS